MIKKGDLQRKLAEGEKVRITDINGLSLIIKECGVNGGSQKSSGLDEILG